MFCGKCGTQNPDTAAFCKNCGTRLNGQVKPSVKAATKTPVRTQPHSQGKRPAPKHKRRKDKKVGIIAVSAIVAFALILAIVLFGGRSYKTAVKQFFDATFDVDGQAIVNLIPDDLIDYVLDESGYDEDELDEMIEDIEDEFQDQIDSLKRYLGDDWDVSYKIVSAENIKGEDLKDIKEDYKDIGVKVSAAKDVEMELTVKAGETENSNTITISLIKVGRSWYLDLDSMGGLL